MAENSASWLGSTLGDAASLTGWSGPYSDTDIANIHSLLFGNDDNQGFVIPGYGNNLEVSANSPAAMNVVVNTGASFVRGKLYENTASNTLTISANASGSPRIDRVVLQVVYANQTIRLSVLEGTPGAVPALPTLTQDATTYEISLAYVWVPNGAATIPDTDVHDEREFIKTFSALNDSIGNDNLLVNSEFMAFSWLSTSDPTTNPPDYWNLVLTPSAMTGVSKPAQMSRGRAVQITVNAASEGIGQTIRVKASTTYAIKLLANVTAGDVGSVVVTTNSAAPGTITRYLRRTGAWVEEKVFYTTEADATTLTLQLLCLNNTDVVQYGQVLAVESYFPGPYREKKEVLCFTNYVSDPGWGTVGAAYNRGPDIVDLMDLLVDYQGLILPGTKAIFGGVDYSNTDSSNQGFGAMFTHSSAGAVYGIICNVGLIPDSSYRATQGWVNLITFDFYNQHSTGFGNGVGMHLILGIRT